MSTRDSTCSPSSRGTPRPRLDIGHADTVCARPVDHRGHSTSRAGRLRRMERTEIYDDLEAELDRIEDILTALDRHPGCPTAAPPAGPSPTSYSTRTSEEAVRASPARAFSKRCRSSRLDRRRDHGQRRPCTTRRAKVHLAGGAPARRDARSPACATRTRTNASLGRRPLRPRPRDDPASRALGPCPRHHDQTAIPYPDTDRLHHIAWLAHRTLPYGFTSPARRRHDVSASSPRRAAAEWTYGDTAPSRGSPGDAGAFCRVGAQRSRRRSRGWRRPDRTRGRPRRAPQLRRLARAASTVARPP